MMNKKEETTQQSLFNSGIAKLERIHNIRIGIHIYRYQRDFNSMYSFLLSFRSELDYKMTSDERDKADLFQQSIQKEFFGKNINSYYKIARKGNPVAKMYEYELFLTQIQYKYGLDMPDKDVEDDAPDV